MGMNLGGGGGVKNDINVTPLIDVVLVLLIIFLVTMPIMMRTITLEVPRKTTEQDDVSAVGKQITVTVKADLTVVINTGDKELEPLPVAAVATTIRPLLEDKKTEKLVFVDFEPRVPWGEVVSVMDSIRAVSSDPQHNDIKVALKMKDDKAPEGAVPAP